MWSEQFGSKLDESMNIYENILDWLNLLNFSNYKLVEEEGLLLLYAV